MRNIMLNQWKRGLITISFALFVSSAHAGVCSFNPGITQCGMGTIDTLMVNGYAKFDGTNISDKLSVNGMAVATNTTFYDLVVKGDINLNSCRVNGEYSLHGKMTAQHSVIERKLDYYGNALTLVNSEANDIYVHKNKLGSQVIHIKSKSNIKGTIEFESGNGLIIADASSHIQKVIGAKIKRVS